MSSDHFADPSTHFSNHPAVWPSSLFAVSANTQSTISSYSSSVSGRSASTGSSVSPPGLCRSSCGRRGRVYSLTDDLERDVMRVTSVLRRLRLGGDGRRISEASQQSRR